MAYWFVALHVCCTIPLMVAKVRSGVDGDWLPNGAGGDDSSSCAGVKEF